MVLKVRVLPCPPTILAGAPLVGGLAVNQLHVGSSPTLPANADVA